jgi:hypothetical protein
MGDGRLPHMGDLYHIPLVFPNWLCLIVYVVFNTFAKQSWLIKVQQFRT